MFPHFRAAFSSHPRNVAPARNAVATFAKVCGFPDWEVEDIRLAAGEALSNAVEHGRGRRSPGFAVFCSFEDDELTVEVRDNGPGFGERDPERPLDPETPPRGYGVYLMRRLMNRVDFERGGSLVRMRRRRED